MTKVAQKSRISIQKPVTKKKEISSSGFTLFEVIIAVAILGISMVMVMQLFAAGLRSARASCDYTRAVVHAKDIMEELSQTLKPGSDEFEDGFSWESEVQEYVPQMSVETEPEESDRKILKLIVKIYWPDVMNKQKSYEIVSLKLVEKEDEL